MRRAALAALGVLGACAPVVTHGPVVRTGPSASITAGAPVRGARCDSACAEALFPAWAGALRLGYAPADPRRPAVLAGVSVPVLIPRSVEGDLYVQGPGRAAPVAYGAGVLASRRHTMPYVQLGRTPENGVGWYVTQGYARLRRFEEYHYSEGDAGLKPVPGVVRPPRLWSPAVTVRVAAPGAATELYAAGMLGSYRARTVDGVEERRRIRLLTIGVTVHPDLRLPPRDPGFRPPFPPRTPRPWP